MIFAGLAPVATPAPARHLVYAFTYAGSQSEVVHDLGVGSSGQLDARAMGNVGTAGATQPEMATAPSEGVDGNGQTDRGSIVVDVLHLQPDTGLVLSVSETAEGRRSAAPATCVVYGDTKVACEAGARVNGEELALLRVLGPTFVDPARLDAKNHWRVDDSGRDGSSVADYQIEKTTDGVMAIAELRVVTIPGAQGYTSTANGAISYDVAHAIPTKIVDDEVVRQNEGVGNVTTVRVRTTLTLTADSGITKH